MLGPSFKQRKTSLLKMVKLSAMFDRNLPEKLKRLQTGRRTTETLVRKKTHFIFTTGELLTIYAFIIFFRPELYPC